MTASDPIRRLSDWPTTPFANLPTPLIGAQQLAQHSGVRPVYVKMDADTGFALGGNKVRKLEFELAPSRLTGVTCLITAGGPQSNHCRVTAAAAARLGLRCVLVIQGPAPVEPRGNALLQRLFGAEIEVVEDRTDRTPGMERVATRIRNEGGTPLIVPIGASTAIGSLGYARAAIELVAQLDRLNDGCDETLVFSSTSSGGTLAGLILGLSLLARRDIRLFGVSADAPADELREVSLALAREAAALLDVSPAGASATGASATEGSTSVDIVPFQVIDDQVGAGYGIPTPKSTAATELFARLEGVVLDPTYTAKAAAGMIAWVERHGLRERQRLVFLHTGGHPGLLA
jgi:1-aminocyclopropane-1-carboxylate deaminase/D-cysteine desulfhydrase-like pyridoxal-dependent ACC family enzyme